MPLCLVRSSLMNGLVVVGVGLVVVVDAVVVVAAKKRCCCANALLRCCCANALSRCCCCAIFFCWRFLHLGLLVFLILLTTFRRLPETELLRDFFTVEISESLGC